MDPPLHAAATTARGDAAAAPPPPAAAPPAPDRSHLTVTAHVPRHGQRVGAKLVALRPLTPSVLHVELQLEEGKGEGEPAAASLAFQPGQWLDVHLPGVPVVGGFSVCSTPARLRREGRLELAVQHSAHPPAAWLHAAAAAAAGESAPRLGARVEVQVGGTFVYDVGGEHQRAPALFVAGGMGITPLISMLRARVEAAQADAAAQGAAGAETAPFPPTVLVYSAKDERELVYRDELESWRDKLAPHFQLYLSTTAHTRGTHAEQWSPRGVNTGRMPLSLLSSLLSPADLHVFLCGPPSMLDTLLPLVQSRVPSERVHFEKWW